MATKKAVTKQRGTPVSAARKSTAGKSTVRKAAPAKAGAKKSATKKVAPKKAATVKKAVRKSAPRARTARAMPDVPALFRLNIEVGDVDAAAAFYGELLGLEGRKQAGARVYFRCGAVTLQVVDVSRGGTPHPAAKALYFSVVDIDATFARAQALGCLSAESIHGTPGGAVVVRPWGERSFYAQDAWGNPLCFVDAATIYAG